MLKHTAKGTPYLTAPEVVIVAATKWAEEDVKLQQNFIEPLFPKSDYFEDESISLDVEDGAQLAKFAGQLCYLSFGAQRTHNAQASEYLRHIKESGHGSVLEHVNYSILLWGVSRALTHELVRHRTGLAYSQVSQRYVAGKHLRFVESPETQWGPAPIQQELHTGFEYWIDQSRLEYERREQLLLRKSEIDYKTATTDQRKAVRQEARRCLPNETEAPILVSGNLRAWRHVIEQRCSPFADAEICRCFYAVFEALREHEPILWEDYAIESKRPDELQTVSTPYRKV